MLPVPPWPDLPVQVPRRGGTMPFGCRRITMITWIAGYYIHCTHKC